MSSPGFPWRLYYPLSWVRQPKRKSVYHFAEIFHSVGVCTRAWESAPVAHCALLCLTLEHQLFGFALLRLFASYAGRYQLTRKQHNSSQRWLRLVKEPRSKPTLGKRRGGCPFLPSLPPSKKENENKPIMEYEYRAVSRQCPAASLPGLRMGFAMQMKAGHIHECRIIVWGVWSRLSPEKKSTTGCSVTKSFGR